MAALVFFEVHTLEVISVLVLVTTNAVFQSVFETSLEEKLAATVELARSVE